MQRPWYIVPGAGSAAGTGAGSTYCYTLFRRIPELDSILAARARREGVPPESVGRTFVAHGLGRAACCRYDLPALPADGSFLEDLEIELASAGAFFDRPRGRLAERVYGTIPAYVSHIMRIKSMMDERRIFNPGVPVREV